MKVKKIFLLLLGYWLLQSCQNKFEPNPKTTDTLQVKPPAALDTLKVQERPPDSLLNTRKH